MQAQKYEVGVSITKNIMTSFLLLIMNLKRTVSGWGKEHGITMIYLNDVEEGGETYFKYLNLKIKPKKGLLLGGITLYINGFPNYKTMHEALPPIKGKNILLQNGGEV